MTVFHDLLALMVESDASDVHIKPGVPSVFRLGNGLTDTSFIPDADTMTIFISQVANQEQIQEYKKNGDLDLSLYEDGIGRFRVNIHRQRGTDSVNMRWVKNTVRSFEELGLPDTLGKIAEAERGIIFVAGTTGSGKSTTLAAMLEYINARYRKHIITIEDPIEYEFTDNQSLFEQREVGLDTSSFSSALVHALRQDPDIIMVGEMRDRTSFDAALTAADTGHVVLTTVHATNAYLTINRLLDLYSPEEQDSIRESLANNLHSIISQRLITKAFGSGRVPAWEIMMNTPVISNMIRENRLSNLPSVIAGGGEDGMATFNQSLLALVNDGLISEEDALEASDNPEALKMNFNGIFLSAEKGGGITS
ncbi:MAG: PilT/PilU family type 4a pilus ATPase [Lentisphaeria bacterium]|nr:PilT/PilU family type 4a pilus ATPase [Lentisphaeria bacterium]